MTTWLPAAAASALLVFAPLAASADQAGSVRLETEKSTQSAPAGSALLLGPAGAAAAGILGIAAIVAILATDGDGSTTTTTTTTE